MRKTLIIGLLLSTTLLFVSCGEAKDTSNNNTNEKNIEQTDKANNDETNNTENKPQVDSSEEKENNDTISSSDNSAKKETDTSKNNDDQTSNKPSSSTDNEAVSKYYGTWKISTVIGSTKITTNTKAPLGKTLVLSKDLYKNNFTGFTIKKPTYLFAEIPAKGFAKGFNMTSLDGTGLKGDKITALDITSTSNPNSGFDEVYIQDDYIVYLQDGVFFKCIKQ